MDKNLIIKIEQKSLKMIMEETTVFEFPDHLRKELISQPGALADFISNCVKSLGLITKDVILLFDARLGFFREYKFNKTDGTMAEKRFYVEDDNNRSEDGRRNITQRMDYPKPDDSGEMDRATIYGIDDTFFRELVHALEKNNLKVTFATSSLIVFKNTTEKTITLPNWEAVMYERIIGLEIDDNFFRAVILDEDKLIHLEETHVPEDAKPEDRNLTDMLTDLLKEYGIDKDRTIVIVSGTNTEFEAKRLMSYSGINCSSVSNFYEKTKDDFPEIYSVTGLDLKKDREESYLYGGWSKRRFSRATTKICICAAIILALLFSMLPIYTLITTGKNEDLNSEINKDKYSERLELIHENRDVLSKLQAYREDQASIDEDETSYSEILTLLREELLSDAVINDLIYDEKSGLIIDFDVTNVSEYENAKDKLNDERQIMIVETSTGAGVDTGQNVQIKVTIPKGQGDG